MSTDSDLALRPSFRPAEPHEVANRLDRDGLHLWLVSLDNPPVGASRLNALLSVDERERAARFHFAVDRRRFACARGMLRHVLSRYAGIEPAALAFRYSGHGKPSIASPCAAPDLHFNLSHSRGWALLGLSHGRSVGVDLEFVRDTPDLLDIARRNFATAEVEALLGFPPALRLPAFFACWTRKEAYVKAVGDGLSAPLDRFEVSLDPALPARLVSVDGSCSAAADWTLQGFRPVDGAWAAAAVYGKSVPCHFFTLL